MLSPCCLNVRRTVFAMSGGSGRDPGGYGYLYLRLRATLTGYVAAGRGGQERGLAARAMRCVYGTHRMYDTSSSRTRVDLRVCV